MINELTVRKLNGQFDYEFKFYEDLNLFIGNIGTGKTTLLNLIWFLISGNLHRVISEIPFHFVSIDTTEFTLSMKYHNANQVKLNLYCLRFFGPLPKGRLCYNAISLKGVSHVETKNLHP